MLLAVVICSAIALSFASPLHKYPYVFLLDVGNEELEKTNTEQLRVSIPGGSLAMKYPVMGEGDTISHVRVSAIDFGTDLKVNILDGGPGYKYVVLVFMGNPGVTFDAVVTLETLPDIDTDSVKTKQVSNTMNLNSNSYQVFDAENGENYQNPKEASFMEKYKKESMRKSNSEVMQASSSFYQYGNDEMTNDEKDTSAEEEDDDEDSFEKYDSDSSLNEDTSKEEEDAFDENFKDKTYIIQSEDKKIDIPRAEQYTSDASNSDDYKPADIVDDSLYEKYQDLKPHFGNGFRIYPQSSLYNKQYQVSSVYDKEDPVEIEQMFNDEEIHNDAKFEDGSNSIDSDYAAAEY